MTLDKKSPKSKKIQKEMGGPHPHEEQQARLIARIANSVAKVGRGPSISGGTPGRERGRGRVREREGWLGWMGEREREREREEYS
jgi:hypothetical protein